MLRSVVSLLLASSASAVLNPAAGIQCMNYASTPTQLVVNPPLVAPQDVVVDGGGDVFVVDSIESELVRIDSDGNAATLLGKPTLQVPVGLAISKIHGDLYIGDENTSTIWHLACQTTNNATCQKYYSSANNISLATSVHPMGLQMDMDDHLYIADFGGSRVMKRNSNTGALQMLITAETLAENGLTPTNPFGPHDIAIDFATHELFVTDLNNDDIWVLKCDVIDQSGLSCDVYDEVPAKLDLTGSAANIAQPSGIVTNLMSTIFVTGKQNGVVAEIKGVAAVDLLSSSSTTDLAAPVSLTIDTRTTSKALYISDDLPNTEASTGLYKLACDQFACAPLTSDYLANVAADQCTNVPPGQSCAFSCADGYSSGASKILCTDNGWDLVGITCAASGVSDSTTVAPAGDDVGVAVGVTIAVLIVVGVGVFLFIRYRQGKLVIKTGDYHSSFSGASATTTGTV